MKIAKITVKEIPNHSDFIDSNGLWEHIPEELYDKEIYFLKKRLSQSTLAGINCSKYMNQRYIQYQLNLPLQRTNNREIFYTVRKMCKNDGGNFDIKSKFTNTINTYFKELNKFLKLSYWGFVSELLKVDSGVRALVYDPVTLEPSVLTQKTFEQFSKTFFYFILCEKTSTIEPIMKEMKQRGYAKEGFYYGISTGGMGTSRVIKLLIELAKIRNFHVFVLHDYDISGLAIFFDIKRWISSESIGVNPDFMEFCGIDENDVNEDYKISNKIKQITYFILRDGIFISNEYERYDSWIQSCLKKRIELNSISSYRLKEDLTESKVKDFCDYLITKLEDPDRMWDLNRYRKPSQYNPTRARIYFDKPKIIEEIEANTEENTDFLNERIEEVRKYSLDMVNDNNEKSNVELNEFLEDHDLNYDFEWKSLIEDQYNQMENTSNILYKATTQRSKTKYRKIIHSNAHYSDKDIMKIANHIISRQGSKIFSKVSQLSRFLRKRAKRQANICQRLIRKTPEYKEIEPELIKNREQFENDDILERFQTYRVALDEKLDKIEEEINND